jgi:hypothetical protein
LKSLLRNNNHLNHYCLKNKLLISFLFIFSSPFSQTDYDLNRELFIGADSIENKKIIAGFYFTKLDNSLFKMELDVMDDWVLKDSLVEYLKIDEASNVADLFYINDTIPAYRFFNANGFEVYIEKIKCFEPTIDVDENRQYKCRFGRAKVILPNSKSYYVCTLPNMFNK